MRLGDRPIDLDERLSLTISRTSDRINFGGIRVLLRELPAVGRVDAPGGFNHFWLAYRPSEEPGRMVAEVAGTHYHFTHRAERSLLFCAPNRPYAAEWTGAEGRVVHFEFQTAFLKDAATSLRTDLRSLRHAPLCEVRLDQPLESLCRLLMREVEQGGPHGAGFFEGVSRALTCALVKRLSGAQAAARYDARVERAIRLFEQRFHDRVTIKEAARVAGLSPDHLVELFRATVGCTPHQYLIRCRLRHARRLIASEEGYRQSLAEIASATGFFDQAHLTHHFQRAFGQSPGRWRQQTLQG